MPGTGYAIYGVPGDYYVVKSDNVNEVIAGPFATTEEAADSLNKTDQDNRLIEIQDHFNNYAKKFIKDYHPCGKYFSTYSRRMLDKAIKSFCKEYNDQIAVRYDAEYMPDDSGYRYEVKDVYECG